MSREFCGRTLYIYNMLRARLRGAWVLSVTLTVTRCAVVASVCCEGGVMCEKACS